MGTRTGVFTWVVALLGLASACAGRYDIGDGGAGGSSGEPNAEGGDDGAPDAGGAPSSSGGKSTAGTGAAGSGGSSTAGESGITGGTGGDSASGGSGPTPGSGGSAAAAGGSGPEPGPGDVIGRDCEEFLDGAPSGASAGQVELWERVSRVVAGEATELPKPELEEPAEMVRWMIEPISSLTPPPGLRRFMDRWAFENAGLEDLSSRWGGALFMHGGSLGGLFTAFGDEAEKRASFASEVEYLTTFPSPSKRGQMLLRTLFCLEVGVPDDDPPLMPVPGKTRRQAVEEATQSPACVGCHVYVDSLGFSLENFDEVGAYRDSDNGLPVDASGRANLTYDSFEYDSFADLAPELAASTEVAACVTRSLFEYALQTGIPEGAPRVPTRGELDYALCEFDRNDYSGQKLLETIVETPSFMLE